MNNRLSLLAGTALLAVVLPFAAQAQSTIGFGAAFNVSDTPSGTARSDYRMVLDPATREHLHVVTYADGRSGERDIFVRHSLDGTNWSPAINLSNTAAQSNVLGAPGNSRRPIIAAHGGSILIAWVDSFCPGGNQGSYTPDEGGPAAFSCIYLARTSDGGQTWLPAEQLTDGTRDAINPLPAASTEAFALAWQEDPDGFPGGPTEGNPGARGNPGTNIHFTSLSRAAFDAGSAFPSPVTVSDNAGTAAGAPAATRPNLQLAGANALLAYEETKPGAPGKNIILHGFTTLTPPGNAAGDILNDSPNENARRVRLVMQSAEDAGPADVRALAIWRQSVGTQEAPADLMLRRAVGGTGIGNFLPSLNLSGGALDEATDVNPNDSIRGHRAVLSGDFAAVVYIHTPSEADRAVQQTNYNTFTRRSLDGGVSWSIANNVSGVSDTTRTTFAPRILSTPPSLATGQPADIRDPNVVFVGWDVRENTPVIDDAVRFDVFAAVSTDRAATFSSPVAVAAEVAQEFELVMQTVPAGTALCTIWKRRDPGLNPDTWFRCGNLQTVPVRVPAASVWSLGALAFGLLILAALAMQGGRP